jgi:hypothetical protein
VRISIPVSIKLPPEFATAIASLDVEAIAFSGLRNFSFWLFVVLALDRSYVALNRATDDSLAIVANHGVPPLAIKATELERFDCIGDPANLRG